MTRKPHSESQHATTAWERYTERDEWALFYYCHESAMPRPTNRLDSRHLTAGRAILAALLRLSMQCVFGGDMACFLYGVGVVTRVMELSVLTSRFSKAEIIDRLLLLNQSFEEDGSGELYYQDSGSFYACRYDIICIDADSEEEVQFQPSCFTFRRGLPTISLLAVISQQIAVTLGPRRRWTNYPRRRIMDALFEMAEQQGIASLDPWSNQSAINQLKKLVKKRDQYAARAQSLLDVCESWTEPFDYPQMQLSKNMVALLRIASEVIYILEKHGIRCALMGGLACALYGSKREPEDVDILACADGQDAEEVKQLIVDAHPELFWLRPSRVPGAQHKVLNREPVIKGRSFKVDILVPPTYDLPMLPQSRIVYRKGMPVIPLPLLFAQKLQAWDHRRHKVDYPRQYEKRLVDKADIEWLCKLPSLHEYYLKVFLPPPWRDLILFSDEADRLYRNRKREFVQEYPELKAFFRLCL